MATTATTTTSTSTTVVKGILQAHEYETAPKNLADTEIRTKLMVSIGDVPFGTPSQDARAVQVIDIQDGTKVCQDLAVIPSMIIGMVGGLLHEEHVLTCGGFSYESFTVTKDCYSLGWTVPTVSMMVKRQHFSAIVFFDDKYLWITGGKVYDVSE